MLLLKEGQETQFCYLKFYKIRYKIYVKYHFLNNMHRKSKIHN